MSPSIEVRRLHTYAGHAPGKLAKTLRAMHQAHPAVDHVSFPDAWGNTLLHTACASRGACAQVTTLLQAGAEVNAVGPYGMTPLAAALMAGQHKAARRVANAGGNTILGAFNEPSERSFLANVFGIDGVTYMGSQAFELEGAFEFGVYPRLADAVAAFAQTCADPQIFSAAMWAHGVRALREAPSHLWRSAKDVRTQAKTGQPMLMLTGWRGHSVCVAVLNNTAVRANRLRALPWSRFATLAPWRFRTSAPSLPLIRKLGRNRGRPAFWGRWMLAWMDGTYGTKRHTPWAHACRLLAPRPQKASNCAVANAKAGILALLVLQYAKAFAPPDEAQCRQMYDEYKRLTTFLRIYTLERYRMRHATSSHAAAAPPDNALINRCEAKLHATKTRRQHGPLLYPHCMRALGRSC